MLAPVKTLTKAEVEWLGTHKCKHFHTYLAHYECFLKDRPTDCPFVERVGYFDIEATNLSATFGYVLSYAILGEDDVLLGRHLTGREIRSYKFDENLMREMCADFMKFHRIVVYYGTDGRFDIPYVRTRALRYGLDFPLYKDIMVNDTYALVRNKLRMHRNRLETACEFFGIPAKGHRLDPSTWAKAQAGNAEALEYVWEHNKEDVQALRTLHHLLINYSAPSKRSI